MTNAIRGGLSALLVGPPGTSKSTMLGSAVEVEGIDKALLLAPTPREINSFNYRKHDIPYEVFEDLGWHPAVNKYKAGAFTKLYTRILELYEDETYDAILLDTYDGAVSLAEHELLAPEKAETPRDTRDSRGYYGSLKYRLENFTKALIALTSPTLKRPKHVFVAVHAQPTKEDDKQKTTDSMAKGIEFLGEVQPSVAGGHRHVIAGEFNIVGFTHLKYALVKEGAKMVRKATYVTQLDADPERHAKTDLVPRLNQEIPSSLVDLFRVIEEAGNG